MDASQGASRGADVSPMFLGAILANPLQSAVSEPRFCQTRRIAFPNAFVGFGAADFKPPEGEARADTRALQNNRSLCSSAPFLIPFRRPPATFEEAFADPNFTINPHNLGFIPQDAWKDDQMQFGTLVLNFFRKRNSMHCKFPFKLYNALLLTQKLPLFFQFIGIRWVNDSVFLVDRQIFAKLLGVRTIDGSLFHQQGNFPSHGFVELSFQEVTQIAKEEGITVDSSSMRFLRHSGGEFTRDCTETDIQYLKWIRG